MSQKHDDHLLIERLSAGDSSVLESILRAYGPAIAAWMRQKYQSQLDREEIRDVLSAALWRLWSVRERYDWLFTKRDAYHDPNQRAIGQAVEFYLHAEVGLKCMIAPNLSLDIEGGLQHISNAGLASRNYGVNALGGSIGLTYYFPWGAP